MTPDDHLLLSQRRARRGHERVLMLAVLFLSAAFLLIFPFRLVPLQRIDAFVPIVNSVLFLGDLITATILFGKGAVLRSRGILALATGFLFVSFIIVAHGLSFPGAFTPTGLLDAGVETTIWLYLTWQLGFPISIIAYALLASRGSRVAARRVRRAVTVCVLAAVLLAFAFTLLTTAGQDFLPVLMSGPMSWAPAPTIMAALVPLLLLGIAIVLLWRRARTVLDVWLTFALWSRVIEFAFALTVTTRFTAGWYAGRLAGVISGLCLLVMLMSEISRLYALRSLALTAQQREREGRLMTLNAVSAAIAHEAKQPLAAIVAEAGAGRAFLERDPPELSELSAILQAIETEGHRAGEAVDSIRAMFANRPTERHLLDANRLIHETTALLSAEFAQGRVTLRHELDASLPAVLADRRQIQHVLLNLFTNAIEAMSPDEERPRNLIIRSSRPDATTVEISVEDSGAGFAPGQAERLFDTFFTTKPNGTGMGLSLCRSIVSSHHGQLWAAAREPHGAVFHVQLPLGDT